MENRGIISACVYDTVSHVPYAKGEIHSLTKQFPTAIQFPRINWCGLEINSGQRL